LVFDQEIEDGVPCFSGPGRASTPKQNPFRSVEDFARYPEGSRNESGEVGFPAPTWANHKAVGPKTQWEGVPLGGKANPSGSSQLLEGFHLVIKNDRFWV